MAASEHKARKEILSLSASLGERAGVRCRNLI